MERCEKIHKSLSVIIICPLPFVFFLMETNVSLSCLSKNLSNVTFSLLMQSVSFISALRVGVGALISVSLLCHQTCEISFSLPFRCAAAGYSLLNTCVVAL